MRALRVISEEGGGTRRLLGGRGEFYSLRGEGDPKRKSLHGEERMVQGGGRVMQ